MIYCIVYCYGKYSKLYLILLPCQIVITSVSKYKIGAIYIQQGGIHKPRGQVGGGRGSLNCPCQSTRGEGGGSRTWSTWTKLLLLRGVFSCIFLKIFLKKKFPSQKQIYLVYEQYLLIPREFLNFFIVIFVEKNLPKKVFEGGGGI